ncbi:MAG: DUF3467 domain-containing protein [Turicibacter sp.]
MNQEEKNKHMYANSTVLELGRFDITLTLAHKVDGRVFDSMLVSMSPQHAKALHHLLTVNLNQYEELFGEINIIERDNSNQGGVEDYESRD